MQDVNFDSHDFIQKNTKITYGRGKELMCTLYIYSSIFNFINFTRKILRYILKILENVIFDT